MFYNVFIAASNEYCVCGSECLIAVLCVCVFAGILCARECVLVCVCVCVGVFKCVFVCLCVSVFLCVF